MKKKVIDFTKVRYVRKSYLPKMNHRFNRFADYKSNGGESDDDDDDEAERKALLKTIKKSVTEQLSTRATVEQVNEITTQLSFLTRGKDKNGKDIDSPFPIETLREMADPKNGVMQKLVDMGLKVQELETAASRQVKDMSVRSQVAAWHEKNKAIFERIAAGEKVDPPAMEIRVASPMLVSTVNAGGSAFIGRTEVEAGINDFLRYPNTFWDFIPKGRTNAPTYVWVNKTNPLGAAAFIGPGVAKPGISFALAAEQSIAKKIAVSAKAGTELLQDIDGMTTMIEGEMKEQLVIEMNSKLMTGTSSSTVPAGIQTLSQLWSFYTDAAAGIKTTNPTYVDAMRSVVGALRSGKLTGEITIFINSIDAANMDIAKATDSGVYLLPPFTSSNGQVIAGAKIITDQFIPVGSFQAGFMRYYRILIYKDYTVTWGWENDDFTKNLVTAVAEMRIHQFFNSINTGAFMFDTFENVITSITKA